MFIKIGNKLTVFTLFVCVGDHCVNTQTDGLSQQHDTTATWAGGGGGGGGPDKMNFCNFRHFSSADGGSCWLKTVWPAETHNLVLSTLGRFAATN